MPAANLAGPPLPPSSSTAGGLPPTPSPGVPPMGFVLSTSLPSGMTPPSSQPGAPGPVFPGSFHSQGPAPPMASSSFPPIGAGYPQGGPGAPAAKPFPAPVVAPPPTGTHGINYVPVGSKIPLIWLHFYFILLTNKDIIYRVILMRKHLYSDVTPFLICRKFSLAEFRVWSSRWRIECLI